MQWIEFYRSARPLGETQITKLGAVTKITVAIVSLDRSGDNKAVADEDSRLGLQRRNMSKKEKRQNSANGERKVTIRNVVDRLFGVEWINEIEGVCQHPCTEGDGCLSYAQFDGSLTITCMNPDCKHPKRSTFSREFLQEIANKMSRPDYQSGILIVKDSHRVQEAR